MQSLLVNIYEEGGRRKRERGRDGGRHSGDSLHSILEIAITTRLDINVYVRSKVKERPEGNAYCTPNIALDVGNRGFPKTHVLYDLWYLNGYCQLR